jgi:hypothetical protein
MSLKGLNSKLYWFLCFFGGRLLFSSNFLCVGHSFLCNLCYGSFSIQQVCRIDYMFELFRMSMRNGHVCMFGEGHVDMDTGC